MNPLGLKYLGFSDRRLLTRMLQGSRLKEIGEDMKNW